jgi:hypothetical protein
VPHLIIISSSKPHALWPRLRPTTTRALNNCRDFGGKCRRRGSPRRRCAAAPHPQLTAEMGSIVHMKGRGRVQRAVRRALVASGGKPVSTRTIASWAYPRLVGKLQNKHLAAICRAARTKAGPDTGADGSCARCGAGCGGSGRMVHADGSRTYCRRSFRSRDMVAAPLICDSESTVAHSF